MRAPRFSDVRHCVEVPARKSIERRIGEDERELELGDRLGEHEEVDRLIARRARFREHFPEQLTIRRRSVQCRQRRLANGLVAESAGVWRR